MTWWNGCDVDSWEDFEERLSHLQTTREKAHEPCRPASKFLFRGQRDSTWELETTLERQCAQPVTLRQYFCLIAAIRPEIENQTGGHWASAPDYPGYCTWLEALERNDNTPAFPTLPGYEYWAYLRHHGFPSPFLDWSRSPDIAAYFAFANAEMKSDGGRVSIYVYWEDIGLGKNSLGGPRICSKGPYVDTDSRHDRQKSQYTFCFERANDEWQFVSHHKALTLCNYDDFATHLSEGAQDLLLKFNIPASEKDKALRYLDGRKITGATVYGSDDGQMNGVEDELMKSLAGREMPLLGKY